MNPDYLNPNQCQQVVSVEPAGIGCCLLDKGHTEPHELWLGMKRRYRARRRTVG